MIHGLFTQHPPSPALPPLRPERQGALSVVNGSENVSPQTSPGKPWFMARQCCRTVSRVTGKDMNIFMATVQVYFSYKFPETRSKKQWWIYGLRCCFQAASKEAAFNAVRIRTTICFWTHFSVLFKRGIKYTFLESGDRSYINSNMQVSMLLYHKPHLTCLVSSMSRMGPGSPAIHCDP